MMDIEINIGDLVSNFDIVFPPEFFSPPTERNRPDDEGKFNLFA